jgi:hypothetical protein
MLRLHRILRLNEFFHVSTQISPVNLILCYQRIIQKFLLSFSYWQTICYYYPSFRILVIIRINIEILARKEMLHESVNRLLFDV